jgi:hypothetical protein
MTRAGDVRHRDENVRTHSDTAHHIRDPGASAGAMARRSTRYHLRLPGPLSSLHRTPPANAHAGDDSASAAQLAWCVNYEIRVEGVLDPRWSSWFDGLQITNEPVDVTVIAGAVVDQAALHGLLVKIHDLGLPLISVYRIDPQP